MIRPQSEDLKTFLSVYDPPVREIALFLRAFILKTFPDANELLYDKSRVLVIGFGTTDKAGDAFVSIVLYREYANLGLLRGHEVPDPKKILKGSGKYYRYISIREENDLPVTYMRKLLKDAYRNSLSRLKVKHELKGKSFTKMTSPKKRRPSPFG